MLHDHLAGVVPFSAFIETFARAAGTCIVTTSELEKNALAEIKPNRTLRLIDLNTVGCFRELNRQSWYAPGSQRCLLAQLMEHYGLELIETRYVVPRKPAARVRPYALLKDQ